MPAMFNGVMHLIRPEIRVRYYNGSRLPRKDTDPPSTAYDLKTHNRVKLHRTHYKDKHDRLYFRVEPDDDHSDLE